MLALHVTHVLDTMHDTLHRFRNNAIDTVDGNANSVLC